MSKSQSSPRFVLKINSARLRRNKWKLNLPFDKARENNEVISINNSQILRWLDELNGITNVDMYVSYLRDKLKKLKRDEDIKKTQKEIKNLLSEIDGLLYKKDYICVVIDRISDYGYLKENGFIINGEKYLRLLGTTGGVKNSTIVFINEKHIDEIRKRIDNGRNMSKEFTPAKLEAYKALPCSASTPVSMPKGICVVHDCVTYFKSDIIMLDDTNVVEPKMIEQKDADIELIDSDGYGMAMPSLMQQWGEDIGENHMLSGCVIRNSFCKGAVFCVDFQKFADDNNIKYIEDIWGAWHNIHNIDLILTESMVKLWDSYQSIYTYLYNCKKNHYTFAITKASEENLENVRNMNYQFLQSYNFTDDDIDDLISPTVNEINDIISGDYQKMILYVKGTELNEKNVRDLDDSPFTALMIDEKLKDDPFIKHQIHKMITKRINEAKVGTLMVPANYSLVSGDPYSLCQSMFGLKVTGLLKAGQIYSKYWIDKNVSKISCFRAPMTCHNNIRLMDVTHDEKMDEFYQYMTTQTIFNSWDTSDKALNGMDKDGDCVINTSMDVIVRNTRRLPAIMCIQRKAPKCVPTEDDFYQSNINSFGNAVGSTTNAITSMINVQSQFEPGSREYKILDYRIKCGQLYQQNAIDKTKGIDAKPMPKQWNSWLSNRILKKIINEEDKTVTYEQIELTQREKRRRAENQKMIADKKPYFMRYIYPKSDKEFKQYIKHTSEKCKMKFDLSLLELQNKKNPTTEEKKFLDYYESHFPLGMSPCVINRICWKIESEFDDKLKEQLNNDFDFTILKSLDSDYDKSTYHKIEKIYKQYRICSSKFTQQAKSERIKSDERRIMRYMLKNTFEKMCMEICPNEDILCNIIVDMCYKSNSSKQFAWDMCGKVFIKNLLKKNNYKIYFPEHCNDGDILFHGERYKIKTCDVNVEINVEDTEDNE